MSQLKVLLTVLIAALPVRTLAEAYDATFDPQTAFCARQTMVLESMNEVGPWLDYVAGLRTGRTAPPDPTTCDSSTLRLILAAVSSPSQAEARAQRDALVAFYASRAMTPDLADRMADQTGQFRYLNDLTAASLLWLICPDENGSKAACFNPAVEALADEYRRTSPVFCDYADDPTGATPDWLGAAGHEAPAPGLCAAASGSHHAGRWLEAFDRYVREAPSDG